MKRATLVTAALLIIAGTAAAQQSMPMPGMDMKGKGMMGMGADMKMMMPDPTDSAATGAYKAAMMKAMQSMPKFSGDADVDFMKQMRPHHQAAIDMAKVVLANGKDAESKKLAQEIVAAQEKEIAAIDTWLKKKGL